MAIALDIEIVRKFADRNGLAAHPRQSIVEHTLAWLRRNRRAAKAF